MPATNAFEERPFRPSADRPADPEPIIVYTTEVQDSGTAAAWWVGGLVTIVAILAVTFLVTRNPNSDQQVANAVAQGRLQGALESTQSTLNDTQQAARQAAQSAADSATLATGATVTAAADADRSAHQAALSAQSANDAAVDASAHVPDGVAGQ
jgi:hypothetical protein